MKKAICLFLILSVLLCCSCSESETLQEVYSEAENIEGLSCRIGIEMTLPDDADNEKCAVISDLIGEVEFTYQGIIFVHRTSKVYSGKTLYGKTEPVKLRETATLGESIEVTINSFKNGETLATWYNEGVFHSLYSQKIIATDILIELCEYL